MFFTPQSSPHFVNRERPRPLKREYQECCKVQQIECIAHRTEPGAGTENTQQLYGAKSVWQMDRHHGHEQNESGGNMTSRELRNQRMDEPAVFSVAKIEKRPSARPENSSTNKTAPRNFCSRNMWGRRPASRSPDRL